MRFFEEGTTADTSPRRQEPSPAGQVGSGIHLPAELPSHAWKPCSSTAFLTLASSLGSRNFCNTHTHTHTADTVVLWEEAEHHLEEHHKTTIYSSSPLLPCEGRWKPPLWPGHSSQAHQARPGTIRH